MYVYFTQTNLREAVKASKNVNLESKELFSHEL